MNDPLFPKTPQEAHESLRRFILEEGRHRRGMLERHPENAAYWTTRMDQAQEALRDLRILMVAAEHGQVRT